jgi:PAS domain S-box-containing protein
VGTARDLPPAWLEAVQDVLYVIRLSPDFAFEFISDSVTSLVGYTPDEHYQDPNLGSRIVDPRDVSRLAAMIQLPPGQPLDVTLRWMSREGRTVWTQHRGIKQLRPDGTEVLIGAARDVTEQVRDRESLAAAREQYRLIAQNASDVVFRSTNEGRLEWLSESVADVVGWSPRELTGRLFIDFVHPENRALVLQAQEMLNRGEPGAYEIRVRNSDGNWQWVAVSERPVCDSDGAVVGRVGSWRDIHTRVSLRSALSSSEALFQTLMKHSALGAVLTDSTARITTVSDTACEILGHPREALLGRLWPAAPGITCGASAD